MAEILSVIAQENIMILDYLDIGTSDFETSLDHWQPGKNILLVEPMWNYLCALPHPAGVMKQCAAISDRSGTCEIFYIPPAMIAAFNLPDWVRGCNSINQPHPNVQQVLQQRNISPSVIQRQTVLMMTFHQLCDLYNITAIGSLKMDTEGHDHVILQQVIDRLSANVLVCDEITFEYKEIFQNISELDGLRNRLYQLFWTQTSQHGDNCTFAAPK